MGTGFSPSRCLTCASGTETRPWSSPAAPLFSGGWAPIPGCLSRTAPGRGTNRPGVRVSARLRSHRKRTPRPPSKYKPSLVEALASSLPCGVRNPSLPELSGSRLQCRFWAGTSHPSLSSLLPNDRQRAGATAPAVHGQPQGGVQKRAPRRRNRQRSGRAQVLSPRASTLLPLTARQLLVPFP